MVQARVFREVVDITGIVLAKLDGTAKGGIVIAVQRELGVPVKLVGLGEGADDLAPFEPAAFVDALNRPIASAPLVPARPPPRTPRPRVRSAVPWTMAGMTVRRDVPAFAENEPADPRLRAWVGGGWSDTPERIARWAELALTVAGQQQTALAGLNDRPMALPTARAESTAELLCAELSVDGLPMDRTVAEQVLAGFIGPRPRSEAEAVTLRAARDAEVLRHAPAGVTADLRSPAQVRTLLARVGVDVPDTRASRLRDMRDAHPLVGALLGYFCIAHSKLAASSILPVPLYFAT